MTGRYEKNGKKYAKRIPNLTFLGGNILDLGNIELEETGALQGSVSLTDGTNPLGIDVYIPGTSFTAKASDTGSFVILYVPAGKYDLIFEKVGYHFHAKSDIIVRSKLITNLKRISLDPVVVDSEPPVAPTPVALEGNLTNDPSPTLSWSKSSDDTAFYEMQVDSLSSFNSTNLRNFSGIKLLEQEVIPQLNDGLWFYRVRAIDYSKNESDWSVAPTVTIDTQPEGTPETFLISTPNNDSTPLLSWTSVTGAIEYHIIISKDENFQDLALKETITGYTSFTPITPLPERVYSWKVASIDLAGNRSDYSLTKTFEIDLTLPDAPNVSTIASPSNNSTPTIDWSTVSSAIKYRVQIDDTSLFSSPFVDSTTTGINFVSTTIADGLWYYRVAAIDAADNQSGFSVHNSFVVDTTPPASPSLNALPSNPTNDKTPFLSWSPASGSAPTWELQIDDTSNFSSLLQNQTNLNQPNFQVSSLLPTGWIYWRVRQFDKSGN